MSIVIRAKNLGIRFDLHAHDGQSMKSLLKNRVQGAYKSAIKTEGDRHFWALKDVSFELMRGEILGVIGHNGAGKSTLLRTIGGIYAPDEGSIEVHGTVSALLSLGTGFNPELTGYENIFLNGVMLGFSEREIKSILKDILEYSELEQFIFEPVKNYSAGMNARLGFSIAAFLHREIMLIDEILGVGDYKFNEKSRKTMEELITDGRTVIIVSHDLDSIRQYATKAIWINKGELMKSGEMNEVIDAYLGHQKKSS